MFSHVLALLAALIITPSLPHEAPMDLTPHPLASLPLAQPRVVQAYEEPILAPIKKDPKNVGVAIGGESGFIADVDSGAVLFAKNPHDIRPMASLTKLMTALVIIESPVGLEGDLNLVRDDFDVQIRNTFFSGETMQRRDALAAMLIGSINELGEAFARSSGYTRADFIKRMNEKAQELNLRSMRFADPTGLDSRNQGSAADVAALLTIVLRNPELRPLLSRQKIDVKGVSGSEYVIESTNLLLDSFLNQDPYQIIGAKTGSLPEAGYCLAQVTRHKDRQEVVVVSLGGSEHLQRFQDVKAMTYWAFDSYKW